MYFFKILNYVCFVSQFLQTEVGSIPDDDVSVSSSNFYDDDGVNFNKTNIIVEGLILSELRLRLAMKVLLQDFGLKSKVFSVVTALFSFTPILYGIDKTMPAFLSMQHDLGVSGTEYNETLDYMQKLKSSLQKLPKTKFVSVIYYSDKYDLEDQFYNHVKKLEDNFRFFNYNAFSIESLNKTLPLRISKWIGDKLGQYDSTYITSDDLKIVKEANKPYFFPVNALYFESLWDTSFETSNFKFWGPADNAQGRMYLSHIPMLSKTELMYYARNDFLQSDILEMPMNPDTSMLIVRPRHSDHKQTYNLETLKHVLELIEKYPKSFNNALADMWRVRVRVTLPVINIIKSKINLKTVLRTMGKIRNIFKPILNVCVNTTKKTKVNGMIQNIIVNITGAAKAQHRRSYYEDAKPRADVADIVDVTIDGLFLFFIIHRREILVAGTYTGHY